MSPSLILALALSAPPPDPHPAVAGLSHLLYSTNAITRSRAARELGALKERAGAAVPHLARALADADPFVARDAAEALGAIGSPAVPVLREALTNAHPRVRLRALVGLSRCCPKDQATVIALARTLKGDADADVRRWAALTLDRIGLTGQGLIANLTAALADKDPSVRMSAAVTLGSYGAEAKGAVERLTPLVKGENTALAAAAAQAIKKITAAGK